MVVRDGASPLGLWSRVLGHCRRRWEPSSPLAGQKVRVTRRGELLGFAVEAYCAVEGFVITLRITCAERRVPAMHAARAPRQRSLRDSAPSSTDATSTILCGPIEVLPVDPGLGDYLTGRLGTEMGTKGPFRASAKKIQTLRLPHRPSSSNAQPRPREPWKVAVRTGKGQGVALRRALLFDVTLPGADAAFKTHRVRHSRLCHVVDRRA